MYSLGRLTRKITLLIGPGCISMALVLAFMLTNIDILHVGRLTTVQKAHAATANALPGAVQKITDGISKGEDQVETFFSTDFTIDYISGSSIVLAGDDLGKTFTFVDDIISIQVKHSDNSTATYNHQYTAPCGTASSGQQGAHLDPTDLKAYFKPGLNAVHVALKDACVSSNNPNHYFSTALWLVPHDPNDDRTLASPVRGYVGHIKVFFADPTKTKDCTAFAVSNDTLATAAHCLEQTRKSNDAHPGELATRVEYYPGQNRTSLPYGTCQSSSIAVNTAYVSGGEHPDDDFGRIKLSCSLTTSLTVGLTTSVPQKNGAVATFGYPSDKPEGTQWTDTAGFSSATNTSVVVTNYVRPGQSGSPLLDSQGKVFAIVSEASPVPSYGARITCPVVRFYLGANAC